MSGYTDAKVYCHFCETYCGREIALVDGAFCDGENVYCSPECLEADQPGYCAECHDAQVDVTGELCQFCTIVKSQGLEAAEAWLDTQRVPKKPPMSVRFEERKEAKGRVVS